MSPFILLILCILFMIIVSVFVVTFIANTMFSQKVQKEVNELLSNYVENEKEFIRKADLEGLPSCVQNWLVQSQVIGKERIRTVRLTQKGSLRMREGQPWMPVEAEQYFVIDEPGFIWQAKVKAAPLLHIVGRDKYVDGKGNMLIKLLSLITIADASGEELDQGALVRYLSETIWFPTAVLSSYITWEEIDVNSAKATMSYKGVTAAGVFTFNEKGEVVNFTAERYMAVNGQFIKEIWSTPMKDYKEFNGIRIPTKGEAVWKLATGDFSYYQVEITKIEYNNPLSVRVLTIATA